MESQMGGNPIEQSFNNRYSLWVREALDDLPENFTITDPSISGNPMVYASNGFLKMTGYAKEEVIGKNGRMFQGPKTNRRSIMEIRQAILEERELQINLLNYKKDGTPFWMFFHMSPVFSKEDGRVVHFLAVQIPISWKTRRCGRNELYFFEDNSRMREVVFGSCWREVWSDSFAKLDRVSDRDLVLDSDTRGHRFMYEMVLSAHFSNDGDLIVTIETVGEIGIEEPCEASDDEKQRAAIAISSILSILIHHSAVTGKLVCRQRCNLLGAGLISSSLNISLGRIKQSFVLTDPHLPDMPIVYASDAFLKLTGYTRVEVLGRNCRFLSGVDTDSPTLFQIKEGYRKEQACTVRILNYRKDKSFFWNNLHISPVRNASGKVAYFVGVQLDEEDSENPGGHGLSPKMRHLSVVGAVKVAVRSLLMGAGSSHDKL